MCYYFPVIMMNSFTKKYSLTLFLVVNKHGFSILTVLIELCIKSVVDISLSTCLISPYYNVLLGTIILFCLL